MGIRVRCGGEARSVPQAVGSFRAGSGPGWAAGCQVPGGRGGTSLPEGSYSCKRGRLTSQPRVRVEA